ncbi:MAG: DNA-directed RNA polymerase subunit beta [Firmicutes bacterium]|nr:DNA-directed RNA polymerase subunit beta [Bacillota bacterium]
MSHVVQYGQRKRISFSHIHEPMELPNLIAIQTDSYRWFLEKGLRQVFDEISPIVDFAGNLRLEFGEYGFDTPKYTIDEAREHDVTYAAPLRVKARLLNKETGEVKEQEVFMGDFPLMTETGTFIINGAERVIVSQLVRSPGIYFNAKMDKSGKMIYGATFIPNRGAWLELETDTKDVIYARIDRTRKLPMTALLRALGLSSNDQILSFYGDEPYLQNTLAKDNTDSAEKALLEIYERLRPGEPPAVESAKQLLYARFFDPKRYDLAAVGRYKVNKKLNMRSRLLHQQLAEDVVDPQTGEIVAQAGQTVDRRLFEQISEALDHGANSIRIHTPGSATGEGELHLRAVEIVAPDEEGRRLRIFDNGAVEEDCHYITGADILAGIGAFLNLLHGVGQTDDIDHLGNRRLRSVGELLQNQFRVGLSRMERVVRERMSIQDPATVTPQQLINIRPVIAAIKEFFGSSQLSQFMDQTNPLSELTHKRRLSALGPGGLTRDRAGFEVRDVHHSHYGRMCPIETPEGPNIGLINSLACYGRINEYGFIETPYRRVDPDTHRATDEIVYLTADEEDNYYIAQANTPLDEEGRFLTDEILCRYQDDVLPLPPERVDFMDVSPKQVVSVATALVPFLENDDASRALMGSNMQRQAVPLLTTEAPYVGTGLEYRTAVDAGAAIVAKHDGVIEKVWGNEIVLRRYDEVDGRRVRGEAEHYKLYKFMRSNQGTCINMRPVVHEGQRVRAGEVLADGPSTDHGELALGKNVLVAYMPWEGYNYEDAILISERLVKDDVFTSVHIEEYECDSRDTKLGPEEITRDIPNVGEEALKNLDDRGIIRIGAEVHAQDILVGKVTPKGMTELTAEERLLHAIFGEKAREVRDTSLRVPHGVSGIVVDVKLFSRENSDELPPGVNELVRVYIAQKRKLSQGDKMSGRHGNKGVVSRILPVEDMPYLPDGTPVDIVLNPLGVPSRMNIGQILEAHLSLAAQRLGIYVATPVFDGATEAEIDDLLKQAGIDADGKTVLYDGRTGEPFHSRVTVGYAYMLKLHHLVDDKIHARSTGPYSLVTQQPLGGKAQFGGQRFGEMEVWALEGYGAAYMLQEVLTVKSDDVTGRVKTYEAIVKGHNVPEPGVPESFKVLVKELQSLALDVRVISPEGQEVQLKEIEDEEDDQPGLNLNLEGAERGTDEE